MKARFLALVAAAGLLGACKDFTSGNTVVCKTQAPTITGTKADTVTSSIGVRYIETQVGTGAVADVCQTVTIDYDLYVAGSATAFDSSHGTGRVPLTFLTGGGSLGVVGVDLGVVGMKQGGKRRLIIPPSLGYGSVARVDPTTGDVVVPANSTIIADVTLITVGAKN
ncbi:MAG: Peptidyl-prolyl cis-trans isomerase [Gemmatimonadetes bacterium]|nr:Peptidyl-prolyl cis-trans isomerase [Gemmatimonadota bacterium]